MDEVSRESMPILIARAPLLDMKGRVYASCIRSSMIYGSRTRLLLADVGLKFEEQMIRRMRAFPRKTERLVKRGDLRREPA